MEVPGYSPRLTRKLSIVQRIREVTERENTQKVNEHKCKLGKLVSVLASATKFRWYKRKGKLLKQKSSELDIEGTLSKDLTCDN